MLIDFRTLFPKFNIKPKGIIQVGAHWAEEHDVYVEMGISKIIYVEPCKEAYDKISERFHSEIVYDVLNEKTGIRVDVGRKIIMFNAACGETESEMTMQVSHNNQGQSNSLLKPELHLHQHPEVVFTDTENVKVIPLDLLPFPKGIWNSVDGDKGYFYNENDYNILVMDTQGYEGQVLKGATETLKHIDCIYTECNRGQTYSGNMEIEEMDTFLKLHNFERVETYWPSPNWTWGDCCYVRESLLK